MNDEEALKASGFSIFDLLADILIKSHSAGRIQGKDDHFPNTRVNMTISQSLFLALGVILSLGTAIADPAKPNLATKRA